MRNIWKLLLLAIITALVVGCGPQRSSTLLSTPPSTAVDNDVYVADAAGRIRALRPDGTEQWKVSLVDEIRKYDSSIPRDIRIDFLAARSSGKIFGLATQLSGRNTGATILFALDSSHLLWQVEVPYPNQTSTPLAIGSDAVYEAAHDGVLYAFARLDGKQTWKCQISNGPLGSPTIGSDGTIYVTGPNYNLHAIAADGKQRWIVRTQS